jgi:DNA-directed RNA polymerase specialized sigma24 family protein
MHAYGHFGGLSRMPFTAHDLRYHAEQSYPLLYAYLHRNAQRFLGALKYDAFEVDTVIGHVVEQLVRLGLFGGGDKTPLTALDRLTDAQFYTFLSRSIRNKAIDRLRKRRLQVSTAAELSMPEDTSGDDDPLDDAVESLWGETPFATPEEITLKLASQAELRNLLKHCILVLAAAPYQLQAVIQELQDVGADELLHTIIEDLHNSLPSSLQENATPNPHMSQHKDHAHKKLRHCLQERSSNLTVMVALRLTEYTTVSRGTDDYSLAIQALAQDDLSEDDVRAGLKELVAEGLLNWQGEDVVRLTAAQLKRLARYYRDE